ncbi:hypothetical protein BD410DRAFT_838861 [Rickenella mellea]|uniref:Uncharacterized protein n=1 Tax=Rickenella mellea TaxID=50990 RepID=A0A4Y7Q6T4_9AGAM|nr:hypothetical protein BD410DRAFT_838861 [Rickenella mellea]
MNKEQTTATDEIKVAVNWFFFDRSLPKSRPRVIELPRSLFDAPSQYCQPAFASELLRRHSCQADENSIEFWKPREPLLPTTCNGDPGWIETINDEKFGQLFENIPFPSPLATAIEIETLNKDLVHLIVSAENAFKVGAVEDEVQKTSKRPLSGAGSDTQDSKPARSSIETDPTSDWLIGLHQALWNKRELRDSIYFEKEITFSDFLALEECLKQIPSRDAPPDKGWYVRDIKLAMLDSILPAVPTVEIHGGGGKDEDNKGGDDGDGTDSDSEDDEGDDRDNVESDDRDNVEGDDQDDQGDIHDNEDDGQDDDIRSLFPVRVRYINLSSLKLKSTTDRCPSPIFIRDEYTIMTRVLNNGPPGKAGSAIVTGQPGKTTYLYERLIDRLLDGMPTYFQTEEGVVFFISDAVTSVKTRTLHRAGDNVVALVDADLLFTRPQHVLLTSVDIQIIVASSPKGKGKWSWLDQLGSRRGMIYAMDLWSYQEFMSCLRSVFEV